MPKTNPMTIIHPITNPRIKIIRNKRTNFHKPLGLYIRLGTHHPPLPKLYLGIRILVNGSSKGYFKSSRGLQQGDPLSPMLFIIVAEALNTLLEKAKQMSLISGFAIEDSDCEVLIYGLQIILLFFVMLHWIRLKCLLKWFELLLGLKINYGKCELIGVRTEDSLVVSLADAFGCRVGKLPLK